MKRAITAATAAPVARAGVIWALDLGTLVLKAIFVSRDRVVGNSPDNICISPRGGLLFNEDGGNSSPTSAPIPSQDLKVLAPNGKSYIFARNNYNFTRAQLDAVGKTGANSGNQRNTEWAGSVFSPDGRVLFVNISIGGVLTSFAAPPVLMVAGTWGWDTPFMMATFGWKAAIGVFINATVFIFFAAKHLGAEVKTPEALGEDGQPLAPVPWWAMVIHLAFLGAVVFFAHHPAVFMGVFLFFLGFTAAYNTFQSRLLLKEGLLVAFFLAGLVVLGGMQQWWLQPAVSDLDDGVLFVAAMALTAITDNAALTYLGSLIEGTSESFRYALVAGAVAGGGLTVIANAPNPAGLSLLKRQFPGEAVSAGGLLAGALGPTAVAAICFWYL